MQIYVIAGPNGSGKSTIVGKFREINNLESIPFINADNIASTKFQHIPDYDKRNLAAAKTAEWLRESMLSNRKTFMFETVLSTDRNLKFLKRAKTQNAEIITLYIITDDPQINVQRVHHRVSNGGHDVPKNKIVDRYKRCLDLLPFIIDVSDKLFLYNNSNEPVLTMIKNNQTILTLVNSTTIQPWLKQVIKDVESLKYKVKVVNSFNVNNNDIYDATKILEQINSDSYNFENQ